MSDDTTGPAMLRVPDVSGYPATVGRRLRECDASAVERVAIAHDRGVNTTVVRARDTAALEWLYDWLDTVDGDEGVEAAARELADRVERELDARLVTDGGRSGTVIEQVPSYPCECPNCGGGVAYATTEADEKVVLCTGDCGKWGFAEK